MNMHGLPRCEMLWITVSADQWRRPSEYLHPAGLRCELVWGGPAQRSWTSFQVIRLLLAQLLPHLGTLARTEVPPHHNRRLPLQRGNRLHCCTRKRTSRLRGTAQITPQLIARRLPVRALPGNLPRLRHSSLGRQQPTRQQGNSDHGARITPYTAASATYRGTMLYQRTRHL